MAALIMVILVRSAIVNAKRIVIKIGSSSLTGKAGEQLDPSTVDLLVDSVAHLTKSGKEVLIVSSGAIATGLAPLGLTKRPSDLATQQAAAAVGQGLLIHRYTESFARYQITASQVLLTIDDVIRRSHYHNAQRTLLKLISLNVVPVINENDSVGTQEIRFGDNDRIAALVSHLVSADLLILITDVDALYDRNPQLPDAQKISDVSDLHAISDAAISGVGASGIGSGGMLTKVEAARIATGAGIGTVLTSLKNLASAFSGNDVGTYFQPAANKKSSRMLWLQHAAKPHGRVIVDAGAMAALRDRGVSLLPAGVTGVEGEFSSGDTVEILGPHREVIARGLIAFDSNELPRMLGRSTKELAKEYGPEFERELIHRDDLVLM
jgi:glutamate 5-kinase